MLIRKGELIVPHQSVCFDIIVSIKMEKTETLLQWVSESRESVRFGSFFSIIAIFGIAGGKEKVWKPLISETGANLGLVEG